MPSYVRPGIRKCAKNRALSSKTSNKEHTLASLGHTEKLRIQYSPCQTIPERIHL